MAGLLGLVVLRGSSAVAQAPAAASGDDRAGASPSGRAPISVEELARRLQRLEQQNATLAEQNQALLRQLEAVTSRYDQLNRRLERIEPGTGGPTSPEPDDERPAPESPDSAAGPRPDSETGAAAEPSRAGAGSGSSRNARPRTGTDRAKPSRFLVGDYDDERGAFVLVRPRDESRVPFELRLDLFTQARYFDFAKSAAVWIDSTGTPRPIRNFNSLEVTRNFIQFSGFGIDPRLQFTSILFSSTALNDTVWLGWINFRFCKGFDLRVGNWAVPGTREWYDSFRFTLGADRLMATTFFRPNISPGIWAQGEPIPNVHYVAMVANSLNRFSQGIERVGTSGVFGGTVWWEPRGDYGPGPSDIEGHCAPSPRIGTNLALAREANQGFSVTQDFSGVQLANPEDTIVRLSDGTPLFRPGALAPGVQLIAAGVQLWTIDAAIKYRGLGLSGEYFFRWLDHFEPFGGRLPVRSLFDHGGLLQGGYFVVPGRLEAFARTSFVAGRFGGGDEYGGGLNWYVRGSRAWRLTFEVLRIDHSPAQNILTGYRAGESGMLYQLQWFTDF